MTPVVSARISHQSVERMERRGGSPRPALGQAPGSRHRPTTAEKISVCLSDKAETRECVECVVQCVQCTVSVKQIACLQCVQCTDNVKHN